MTLIHNLLSLAKILCWFTCFVQVVNLKLFCQFYKSKQKQFHVPNSYKESTVKFFSQESYQPRKLKRIKTSELVSIPYHPKLFTHFFLLHKNLSNISVLLFLFQSPEPTIQSIFSDFQLPTGHNLLIHQESRHAHYQFLWVAFLMFSWIFGLCSKGQMSRKHDQS